MLEFIEEANKYIEITGFRNVRIEDPKEFMKAVRKKEVHEITIQFFDADLVATWRHLYFAVLNAFLAIKNRENISKSLEVETLLYASAQRQISKAIDFIGVKQSSTSVATVILVDNPRSVGQVLAIVKELIRGELDDTVLELTESKIEKIRKAFDISDTEIETMSRKSSVEQTLVNLVIERSALLPTQL